MEFTYNKKIPIKNSRNAAEVATSNIVKGRRNVEVVEENYYNNNFAEVILIHTAEEDKDCQRRHIIVSGEEDEVTINAVLRSSERVSGLEVGIKGTARNIYSEVAGLVRAEEI